MEAPWTNTEVPQELQTSTCWALLGAAGEVEWGEMLSGVQGSNAIPSQTAAQEKVEASALFLLSQLSWEVSKEVVSFLSFFKETRLAQKFDQGFAFADHQQLAAYMSARLGLLRHFNPAVI